MARQGGRLQAKWWPNYVLSSICAGPPIKQLGDWSHDFKCFQDSHFLCLYYTCPTPPQLTWICMHVFVLTCVSVCMCVYNCISYIAHFRSHECGHWVQGECIYPRAIFFFKSKAHLNECFAWSYLLRWSLSHMSIIYLISLLQIPCMQNDCYDRHTSNLTDTRCAWGIVKPTPTMRKLLVKYASWLDYLAGGLASVWYGKICSFTKILYSIYILYSICSTAC